MRNQKSDQGSIVKSHQKSHQQKQGQNDPRKKEKKEKKGKQKLHSDPGRFYERGKKEKKKNN